MASVLFGGGEEGGAGGALPTFNRSDDFYSSSSSWPTSSLAGAMGTGGASSSAYQRGQGFGAPHAGDGSFPGGDLEDYENEPPLLQELGVDFTHIRTKTTAVLSASAAERERRFAPSSPRPRRVTSPPPPHSPHPRALQCSRSPSSRP